MITTIIIIIIVIMITIIVIFFNFLILMRQHLKGEKEFSKGRWELFSDVPVIFQ